MDPVIAGAPMGPRESQLARAASEFNSANARETLIVLSAKTFAIATNAATCLADAIIRKVNAYWPGR